MEKGGYLMENGKRIPAEILRDPASFRDPASNVYAGEDQVYREIYPPYFKEYDHFMDTVYPELLAEEWIIPHKELSRTAERIVIAPEMIDFISYPYEWTFTDLKRAALTTLRINQVALKHGMMLKDASAYNIQWYKGSWRLIDTCSFMFRLDTPWPAYSQFLRHFVNPLLLMKYVHTHENKLSQIYLDGLTTGYTSNRLPWSAKFWPGYWIHVYSQTWADVFKTERTRPPRMSTIALTAFLTNLYTFVQGLEYKPVLDRGWIKYAELGSYTEAALKRKKEIVSSFLGFIRGRRLLDLGANTGEYSRMAGMRKWDVLAVDADHDCMFNLNQWQTSNILPLVVDLNNPPPAIGWANRERRAFWDRIGKVDCTLALALIHHLSIRNNVPLGMVADLLADHTRYLIVEFVPQEDKQAKRLLAGKNIPEYSRTVFLDEFSRRFKTIASSSILESMREIYLMECK